MSTRIFVLEDHATMRDTLVGFVSVLPDTEICGSAASAEDALVKLAEAQADLVLVDISLPGMSGLDFLREARKRWPRLQYLVLTGHDEAAYMSRAISLGANGYLAKGNAERLKQAIDSVLQGKQYPEHKAGSKQ
jgi:DNA-binding NarL/FixJ family response regulator